MYRNITSIYAGSRQFIRMDWLAWGGVGMRATGIGHINNNKIECSYWGGVLFSPLGWKRRFWEAHSFHEKDIYIFQLLNFTSINVWMSLRLWNRDEQEKCFIYMLSGKVQHPPGRPHAISVDSVPSLVFFPLSFETFFLSSRRNTNTSILNAIVYYVNSICGLADWVGRFSKRYTFFRELPDVKVP